jgi:hypothetical protein
MRGIIVGDLIDVTDGGITGNYSGRARVSGFIDINWVDIELLEPFLGAFGEEIKQLDVLLNRVSLVPQTQGETLPTDSEARKNIPLATGLLDYFPAALAAVAAVSKAGNDKHNPGEPLHWARGKSMDQADCIGRHLLERGGIDPDTGLRHSAQLAWRSLALLQLELEEAGEAPLPRGASKE